MKIDFKKIATILACVCAVIFIGSSVSGWFKKGEEDKKDDTGNQTAIVQTVTE